MTKQGIMLKDKVSYWERFLVKNIQMASRFRSSSRSGKDKKNVGEGCYGGILLGMQELLSLT